MRILYFLCIDDTQEKQATNTILYMLLGLKQHNIEQLIFWTTSHFWWTSSGQHEPSAGLLPQCLFL